MDYLSAIQAEIRHHYDEIAKLETAMEVIQRMTPSGKGGVKKADQPLFTVRRKTPALTARNPGAKRQTEITTEDVRGVLRAAKEPLRSAEIIRELGATDKSEKQRVYSAVTMLTSSGEIERVGKMKFQMVAQSHGVADEGQSADDPPQSEASAVAA